MGKDPPNVIFAIELFKSLVVLMTINELILENSHTNVIFVATEIYLVPVYGHTTTSIVIQVRAVSDTVQKPKTLCSKITTAEKFMIYAGSLR